MDIFPFILQHEKKDIPLFYLTETRSFSVFTIFGEKTTKVDQEQKRAIHTARK